MRSFRQAKTPILTAPRAGKKFGDLERLCYNSALKNGRNGLFWKACYKSKKRDTIVFVPNVALIRKKCQKKP